MRFKLIRETKCGGWIALDDGRGIADAAFAHVYTNHPNTRTIDPELQKAVALMVTAPELADLLKDLRSEVMHDCNTSSASAERYADILKRVDALLARAGVA